MLYEVITSFGRGENMKRRVLFIEGDGIGREVWAAGRPVLDRAVELSFDDGRGFEWVELLAGKKRNNFV